MKIVTISLLLAISGYSNAQQVIESFTRVNVVDQKSISLDQFNAARGIVILFTGNECPFDNYYKSRIKQLINAYNDKVQFLLVNSYIDPQEAVEKMAIHYTDLDVPYLADKDQSVMRSLGARKSPEAFLLKPADGKFLLVYSGAIDDNPQVASDTKQNFLKDSIDKLLAGLPLDYANNRAIGCTIRSK